MTETTTAPTASARFFSTRTLLTLAAIGVAGGIVVSPLSWLSQLMWVAAPFLYGTTIVPWILPGVIAQAIVPRGGSSLVAGLVAGLISVPFTGGFGPLTLFLFVAFFQELPYAVTRWRRWGSVMPYIGAATLSVAYTVFWWFSLDAETFPPAIRTLTIALLVVAIFASTALARAIASGLRRAGVGVR